VGTRQARLGAWLGTVAAWCEAHPGWMIGLIVALYVPAVLELSHLKPLWHDELYTLFIARSTTVREMWDLARVYDLNPPLPFLLTHACYRVFGVNTLTTRLPEMLGFLAAILCLFAIVRRRMGALFGLFAALLLMASVNFPLAVEARPYGLMFGFFLAAILSWQHAAAPEANHRIFWTLSLALALSGLLLSHVFGVAATGALLAAELTRSLQQRRIHLSIAAALLLPFAVTLLYVPLFANHGAAMYPLAFQVSFTKIALFYLYLTTSETAVVFLLLAAVTLLLGAGQFGFHVPAHGPRWSFNRAEWLLIWALLALPLALMLLLMHSHGAFFLRYGAIASFALEMAFVALIARLTLSISSDGWQPDPRVALLGAIAALVISGLPIQIAHSIADGAILPTRAHSEPKLQPCEACARTAALDPSIPLVAASGLTFVEMNYRESDATTARLYYLVDPQASNLYSHANIFERMPQITAAFHLRGHSEPYTAFVAQHKHFFVLGMKNYPEDWLLPKLKDDGASIKFLGYMPGEYHISSELYEVTLHGNSATH
jgi:hypothetical protein